MLNYLSYSAVTLQHGTMNYCYKSDAVTPPTTAAITHAERLDQYMLGSLLWTVRTCLLLLKLSSCSFLLLLV